MDTTDSIGIKNAAVRKLAHELNINGLRQNQLELAGRLVNFFDVGAKAFKFSYLRFQSLIANFGKINNQTFRFLYKADSDPKWMEHELDYVFIVRNFNLPLSENKEEVEKVKCVDRHTLNQMFQDGKFRFSPWFHLMYKSKWLDEWWTKLDKNELIQNDGKIHKLN
jgi:isopentenyldiphosphate isomerase